MATMQSQSVFSKSAEIKYRSKIVQQQLGKAKIVENEPTSQEFKKTLKEKLKLTRHIFKKLQKHIPLSPYLEIGSEHCLRPSLLESEFKSHGFATDISFYSLSNAKRFAKLFGYKKTGNIVCADAYSLPFKSNSFPFVFTYETLHHFPNPKPALIEAYRVLAPGGICLIGSDPIEQSFQLNLWYRPNKLRLWEKLLKYTLVLPFISRIGKTETEEGIFEGAFSLKVWQDALSTFDEVDLTMKAFPFGPEESVHKNSHSNWIHPSLKTKLALLLFGGGLQAICQKSGSTKTFEKNLDNLLICPTCLKNRHKENRLAKSDKKYSCSICKNEYHWKNNVLILLEKNLGKKILPFK